MKLAIASDVHLEFGDCILKNDENADVLILAGDIMTALTLRMPSPHLVADRFRNFLKRCSFQFPQTIYIPGNHEFYHGRLLDTPQILRRECNKFDNIKFLDRETFVLNDITFIGETLWTDCNKFDPITLHALTRMMMDFNCIRNENKGGILFSPADSAEIHRKGVQYIKNVIAEKHDQKFVVITHHAPSALSVHEKYYDQTVMNGAFYSDLSELILDSPQIKGWIHGHMHDDFDYMLGETRVICHPRGYVGYERNEQVNPYNVKYVEI